MLYVVCSRDKLKLLCWHHNGYVLLYKRLEKGQFVWPRAPGGQALQLSLRELQCLLEGGDVGQLTPVRELHYKAM